MTKRRKQPSRFFATGRRRGQSVVEFALVLPVMVLMLTGTVTSALIFQRQMTVVQLSRNAGNMFVRGVDFAKTENQEVLLKAAAGLGMTTGAGSGVIYLSRLVKAEDGSTNSGELVIVERYVIGDPSISPSRIGTPAGHIWPDPDKPLPHGDVKNPDGENSAQAVGLPDGFQDKIPENGSAFVAEVFHKPLEVNFVPFHPVDELLYGRSIY